MRSLIFATPDDVGPSSSGLERARAYVATGVERGAIAGAVLLVARHDQVAQLACVGLRDIEAGAPMTPDTIVRIRSMTKPIVSVGALMLVEAGRLRLDDLVSRYVPELAEVEVFAGVEDGQVRLAALERPITVFHLLTHTSGLAYGAPHPSLAAAYDNLGDEHYRLPEMMRRLAERPLAHQPGEGWTYGYSHDVLGRVIEVAADQPLDDYLASKIFAPLAMVDSGFYVPPEQRGRLAAVYESADGGLRRVVRADADRGTQRIVPLLRGGSGCVSTGPDYLRFTRMLLRRGELDGVRLLRPETVELMTSNQLGPRLDPLRFTAVELEGQGFGFGVGVTVDPSQTPVTGSEGTYGWAGAYDTWFWIDPVKELIGICMAQFDPLAVNGVAAEFWSLVCQSLAD